MITKVSKSNKVFVVIYTFQWHNLILKGSFSEKCLKVLQIEALHSKCNLLWKWGKYYVKEVILTLTIQAIAKDCSTTPQPHFSWLELGSILIFPVLSCALVDLVGASQGLYFSYRGGRGGHPSVVTQYTKDHLHSILSPHLIGRGMIIRK